MNMPTPFVFDDTIQLIQTTVRQFTQKSISPIAEKIDQDNGFPNTLWPALGELGLLGITVEAADGGSGLGYFAHVIAMEEISRSSASIGLSYGAHSNLCVNQLRLHGTPAQKAQFLPKLISGEHVGALAMSEVGAGSDVMSLTLNATPCEQGYRLNGTKMWITNGPSADVLIVYARTAPDTGSKGITAFIIEKGQAGYQTAQKLDKLGMRGSDTCELIFEDCFVPESHCLGPVNQGAAVLMQGLNYERVVLAAGPLGIMQACLDIVLPYIHERQQFGRPIGEFQLIQAKVADMYTALSASRALVYAAAQAADQGQLSNETAAAAILFSAEQATQVALSAIQCLGGNGYINDYPTGRLLRDAKLYEIGAGTSEIRRLIIGKALFNASK